MMLGKESPAADSERVTLWLVKFGATLWLVARWRLLSERTATVFLTLFAVVTLVVVAYNAVTILQYRGVITATAGI